MNRIYSLGCKVSKKEYDEAVASAAAEGVTVSDLCRKRIFGSNPPALKDELHLLQDSHLQLRYILFELLIPALNGQKLAPEFINAIVANAERQYGRAGRKR